MGVQHRFLPPAHVMWLGLVPQLLPGEGVKRKKGGCWLVRSGMEKILNARVSAACLHGVHDCSLISFHHWNIQELKSFWLTTQLRIQNLWAAWRGVGTLSDYTVLRCPWARYKTPKCYRWYFIHSDTSLTVIAWWKTEIDEGCFFFFWKFHLTFNRNDQENSLILSRFNGLLTCVCVCVGVWKDASSSWRGNIDHTHNLCEMWPHPWGAGGAATRSSSRSVRGN